MANIIEAATKMVSQPAPKPANEIARLAALHRYNILDTPPEEAFDRITQLAADMFDVPIALVSLVDEHRQWFKSRVGLSATETSRDLAFCAHAILGDDICMVPDTQLDDRFRQHPLVLGEPAIRFYAGAPLITLDGFRIGTLCVIARAPRPELTGKERRSLEALAAMTVREIETRLDVERRVEMEIALRESDRRFRGAFETAGQGMAIVSPHGRFLQVNAALTEMFRYDEAELLDRDFQGLTYADDLEADLAQLLALIEGRIPHYSMEKRFIRKDGSVIWTLLSVALVRDDEGKPLHFVSQIRDIQHRKNNEAQIEALVERNTLRFRRATSASGNGIWARESIIGIPGCASISALVGVRRKVSKRCCACCIPTTGSTHWRCSIRPCARATAMRWSIASSGHRAPCVTFR